MAGESITITKIETVYESVQPWWDRPVYDYRPFQGLLIFKSGGIRYNMGGQEVLVEKGDILKLTSTVPYNGVRLEGAPPGFIVIDFSTVEPDEYEKFPLQSVTKGLDFDKWYGDFSALLREWQKMTPESELICRGMLYGLLGGLISASRAKGKNNDRLTHFFQEHFSDPAFTVEAAAKALFLSPSQLQRRLRIATGLSPNAYLQNLRLISAREMLLSTEDSIERIALSVGFKNQFYFSRCFKDFAGESPLSYRKTHRI